MRKVILFAALLTGFNAITRAEAIPDSPLFIGKLKISDKLLARLAHRNFDNKLFIKKGQKKEDILKFLGEPYNLEDVSGEKRKILNLTVSTYGILDDPNNGQSYHDVASCVFVERKSGCVLYSGSINLCAGHWDGEESWVTDEGGKVDFLELRNSVLAGNDEGKNPENHARCVRP
ncbi:hypothetical protein HNO92_002985 [Chromobacterium alkanivorans]|uniref:hypothetical protein n=1 Tax=Chromobacterium alkanivorans TaxID=1071719 RepID=UPI0021672B38|nr:hypothetical protein [Chromobacterium alkanivorans]MCS3803749.1 hypothetical protein [Chromobacterium alkanivorans]MCS3818146.1 hypothetical protein [Chromobacterium alkanivorans]MCS3874655.1 hypothetical protein [Chromobacterium alkanivorans]